MSADGVKKISFVIVSHGHKNDVFDLLKSLVMYWKVNYEVIIVDNIRENIKEFESMFDNVKVVENNIPLSFSKNNNLAISMCKYDNIFIANPDLVFHDFSVPVFFHSDDYPPEYDNYLIYPKLLNEDFTEQIHYNAWPSFFSQSYRLVLSFFKVRENSIKINKDWFYAAAIITNKSTFRRLGGFEELFPLYCEDVDFCYKAKLLSIPYYSNDNMTIIHKLGGESKSKYLVKALRSNFIWRYVKVRNWIRINMLKNSDFKYRDYDIYKF